MKLFNECSNRNNERFEDPIWEVCREVRKRSMQG
jgi:hypothetical protein